MMKIAFGWSRRRGPIASCLLMRARYSSRKRRKCRAAAAWCGTCSTILGRRRSGSGPTTTPSARPSCRRGRPHRRRRSGATAAGYNSGSLRTGALPFMSRRLVFAGWILLLATPAVAQHRQAPSSRLPAPVFDTSLYNALEWREIGPFRGGRVTAVAGHADQPLTYYFGGTGGGVWKTTDGGLSWAPISDKDFRAGSIGAIEVAPSDPNVIYVGTGESPIRGNVSPGNGVYKSTDAGKTWTHVGLANAGQIGAIRVHPANADLVYVAVLGHAFGPNPDRGLFRSTDGGDTWKEITRNDGLPKGVIGKIGVTVSANHDRVWAIVEADSGGVFRSDDGGDTWRRTNDERNLRQRAWYYSHIHADPKDPETVYVLNTGVYRSVDGGRTFTQLRAPHGDHHGLWIAVG